MELNRWQKRFWLDSLQQRGNAANIAMVFRMTGTLDTEVFVRAVQAVVAETETMHSICRQEGEQVELVECQEGVLCVEIYEEGEKEEGYIEQFGQRPFRLDRDLPIRLLIIKKGRACYQVEFVFHHICVDLVSLADFWQLLSACYGMLLKDGAFSISNRPVLADYSAQENKQQEDAFRAEGLKYWQGFLSGMQSGILFPPGKKSDGGCVTFKLGNRLHHQVACLAERLHSTPFRILMNAWLWTLSAYSGNRCPAVSYAVNVRPSGLKGLIAPFVNNLPWGMSLEDNPTFEYCIRVCNRQRQESKRFQEISITEIMEYLRRCGELQQGEPFLNTGLNYANWSHSQGLEISGVQVTFERRIRTDSYFDLTLEIEPGIPGYCRFVYGNDFKRSTILGMLRMWKRILTRVCRHPEIHFAEVPLLTQREMGMLYWKSGEMEVGTEQKFVHFLTDFDRMVKGCGHKIALRTAQGRVTYGELDRMGNQIARAVRRESGGKPVGICLKRDCNYIAVILGILKAGVPYVPFDTDCPAERLKFMAEDCGMRLVITHKALKGLTGSRMELYAEDLLLQELSPEEFVYPVSDAGQAAYIIYTSGTTGKPKGVAIHFGNLCCLIRNAIHRFRLTRQSVVSQYANLAFDASVMEIFPTLSMGATLCLVPEDTRRDPAGLVRFFRQHQVTVAYVTPMMLTRMEDELPALKTLVVGGESTPAEVLQKWRKKRRLLNVYGPTECTVFVTTCLVNQHSEPNDIGEIVDGACGFVMDEYGRLLPNGIAGELCIGGWQLTDGYLNRDDLNQEKFRELHSKDGRMRLYRTGDRVIHTGNDHYLFLGRIDSQVKIRGFRIELGEIEAVLNQLEGIRQALVQVRGKQGQERLVAYVQPESLKMTDTTVWKERLKELLPLYMLPSAFVVMETFPLTVNGKTDFRRLPEPEQPQKEYVAPDSPLEGVLAKIAGEVLEVESIGVTDDLFELGLSSLTVVVLSAQAAQAGITLPVSLIYRERSLRKMAAVCGQDRVCHWYSPLRESSPVVVLVCGHTDFDVMLRPLAEALKQNYAVLVVESFHDYYSDMPGKTDFQGLLAFYEQAISGMLPPDTLVYAFTGHCFGGEIAYALAVRWALGHIERPEVWVFNALACRQMPENWMQTRPLESETQQILWELILKKQSVTQFLIDTAFMPSYTGRVVLFVSTEFTPRLAGPDLPELANIQVIQHMKEMYRINPENWRMLADHLEVYPMAGDHWSMMRLLTCEPCPKQ